MQTKDPKQKKKNTILGADLTHRIYGLDILRAYAIISIFINHTYEFFPEEYHHAMRYSTQQGVPIFFVLSGFLIGNILIKSFKEEALDRKLLLRFWTNRWMRTLPLYYIILALLFFCTYVLHLAPEPDPEKFGLLEKSSYLVFLYNFAWDKFPFFAEAWTLAVEEWFYFLTPLIIFFFRKCGFSLRQSVLTTIILVIFIGTNIRAYRIIHNISITHQVLPSLDCLMYGILGAYINTYHNKWWTNHQRIYFVPGLILFLLVGLQWVLQVNVVIVFFASTVLSIGILLMMPCSTP